MLLNLAQDSFFGGYSPFLNWWKTGSAEIVVSSTNGSLTGQQIWDNGTYFNTTTGELNSSLPADFRSLSRGFFTPVSFPQFQYLGTSFGQFAGQQWDVSWQGCSTSAMTVTTTGTLGTGGTSSFSGNSGTITLGSSGFSNVGLTFTPTVAGACYSNPPTHIVVSQHQYAASVAAGKVFNPDWIAEVNTFAYLRLMDWMETNSSGISDVSQLADVNFTTYIGGLAMPATLSGTISGTVFSAGDHEGGNFAAGQALFGFGGVVPAGTTIVSQASGTTGGVGTYNLSASAMVSSPVAMVAVPNVGSNQQFGPKSGISPALACELMVESGTNIEYPIPPLATDAAVTAIATAFKACTPPGLRVKFSYGNENWNPAFFQFDYMFAQTGAITGFQFSGFRAAQVMELIANVYGTSTWTQFSNPSSQWVGALGSQMVNTAVTSGNIEGAQSWISGGATHTLTQLINQIDVAPYFGDFYSGNQITNITIGASPTITAANSYTNGQVIKLFVSSADGTVASVLNNANATVSNVSSSSFQINISTAGLTYSNPGCPTSCANTDFVMDATLFRMADQSLALSISTPATFPTKYSFFEQQYSKAVLNGSASDASYGTLTIPAGTSFITTSGGIQSLFEQQSLIANIAGIVLGQYEGGNSMSLAGIPQANPPLQMVEYMNAYNWDTGVVGDTTNTIQNVYATSFSQYRGALSAFPAQFNDAQPQGQFGPWGALRFIPGDNGNPKWLALATETARAPFVDPTPAATGTYAQVGSDQTNSSTSAESFSANIGTAATYAIVAVYSQNSPTISSVTVGGVALGLDVANSGAVVSIYSGAVPAGTATRTIAVNWVGAAFLQRGAYVWTASNLATNAAASVSANNLGANGIVSETKGSLIVCAGNFLSGTPDYSASSIPPTLSNNASGAVGTAAWWLGNVGFTSQLFACGLGGGAAGSIAIATYR
jgi:hypothetical protein